MSDRLNNIDGTQSVGCDDRKFIHAENLAPKRETHSSLPKRLHLFVSLKPDCNGDTQGAEISSKCFYFSFQIIVNLLLAVVEGFKNEGFIIIMEHRLSSHSG